jgi:hypothetical protein
MIEGLLSIGATMAGFVAGIAALHVFLSPASLLRLGIFRPYRGDAWPRGVQEGEPVRFDLRPKAIRTPIRPTWSDVVVQPEGATPASSRSAADAAAASVEDLSGESVEVGRLDHVEVHRQPH